MRFSLPCLYPRPSVHGADRESPAHEDACMSACLSTHSKYHLHLQASEMWVQSSEGTFMRYVGYISGRTNSLLWGKWCSAGRRANITEITVLYHTYGSCQISPHLRTRHSSPSVPILLLLRLYLHGLHLHTTHQHASKSIVIVNLAQFWLKLLKRLFPQSHITRGQVMYINLCTTLTKEKA